MKKTKDRLKSKMVTVIPLKNFVIHMNEFHYELKKGEMIEIDKIFLPNLKTENVIKQEGN